MAQADKEQLTAIRHTAGPMMVLAGPGSGKTTVITQHARYLIETCGISPANILVITFTKAAALEMKARFLSLIGERSTAATFGTFHAVFFTILRHAYGYTAANIIREDVRYTFFRDYIHRHEMTFEDEQDFIASLISEISIVKNEEINPADYYAVSCPEQSFRDLYEAYCQFLYKNRLIDFDDMLVYTKQLLAQRPDILAAWQKKFSYILIDEFQDINRIQYDIVRMLAAPKNNLFIVGDDDQSIYRFRGARPELMLNFPKDYPEAVRVTLKYNYRCGKAIQKVSRSLIGFNERRFQKQFSDFGCADGTVINRHFEDQRKQNLFLIGEIRRLVKAGYQYRDIAILCRTNRQPLYLMEQLGGYNIPYHSTERIPVLYDHWIAKDLFTYVRLAQGDRSTASFLRIMNRPNRYLSRDSLPDAPVKFTEWMHYYKNQAWMGQRLRKLREDLKVLSGMNPYSSLVYIRKAVGYEDYLKDYARERNLDVEELLEVLYDLTERAREYDSFPAWEEQISRVREEARNALKQKKRESGSADAVEIGTYHASKGLEYRVVFLPDLNETITPYKKAVLPEDVEEERRMLYVAMTRAKEALYLFESERIRNKDMEASRFLNEIG